MQSGSVSSADLKRLVDNLERQKNPVTRIDYGKLIQACGDARSIAEGKRVHAHIAVNHCLHGSIFLGNHLIQMYGKCGCVGDAIAMFVSMSRRNVVSWNSIIAAYARNADCLAALHCFREMLQQGEAIDSVLLITVLSVCTEDRFLGDGRMIHACGVESGFADQTVVATAVLSMYSRCRSLKDVCRSFDELEKKDDVISWNAMITASVELGGSGSGVLIFRRMLQEGVKASRVSFMSVLSALVKDCEDVAAVCEIHRCCVVESGLEGDEFVGNSLITAYGRFSCAAEARAVFDRMCKDQTGTWNALITAYSDCGQLRMSLESYAEMRKRGVEPDQITFVSALDAVEGPEYRSQGEMICGDIAEQGFEDDVIVSSAMLSMFCRSGSLEDAERVFLRLGQKRNVITWNSMISAYTDFGRCKRAIGVFREMQNGGVAATEATFLTLLTACANSADLTEGKKLQEWIVESGREDFVLLQNGIINMYGKSGGLDLARGAFERMNRKQNLNLTSWNTLIGAYARHGEGKQALVMLSRMHQEGVKPSDITYTGVLTACSHAGLFKAGRSCYEFMTKVHGLRPSLVHYGCMVDLLGRGGWLEEAENLIRRMPMPADSTVWTALLAACKIHGDVDRAKLAADRVLELDPMNPSAYVALQELGFTVP